MLACSAEGGSGHQSTHNAGESDARHCHGGVNMSWRDQAAPQMTTNGAHVSELVHQMDRLSTPRGGQHPYADSRQCAKCGRTGHLASKCGIKCTACGRWGHLAEVCHSKPSADAPQTSRTTNPRPARSNRSRPTCDFSGKMGHVKDKCYKNLDGSNFRPRSGTTSTRHQGN